MTVGHEPRAFDLSSISGITRAAQQQQQQQDKWRFPRFPISRSNVIWGAESPDDDNADDNDTVMIAMLMASWSRRTVLFRGRQDLIDGTSALDIPPTPGDHYIHVRKRANPISNLNPGADIGIARGALVARAPSQDENNFFGRGLNLEG